MQIERRRTPSPSDPCENDRSIVGGIRKRYLFDVFSIAGGRASDPTKGLQWDRSIVSSWYTARLDNTIHVTFSLRNKINTTLRNTRREFRGVKKKVKNGLTGADTPSHVCNPGDY